MSDAVDIGVVSACAVPVVTIEATDNTASEPNPLVLTPVDVARFVVKRTCGTNHELLRIR